MIFSAFKKIEFLGILGPPGNHASPWIRDLWSKGISLIFGIFLDIFEFLLLDDFFRFSKKWVFGYVLVHPTVVSVLLSASVKRYFVSCIRDFFFLHLSFIFKP